MQLWLGRPSGHSVYYTLIGTFETEAEASAAFAEVRQKIRKENHVRHKEREVQINPADEVWEEDELDSDKQRLENYGADVEAIENFWDFEVAFNFDTPSATEEEVASALAPEVSRACQIHGVSGQMG